MSSRALDAPDRQDDTASPPVRPPRRNRLRRKENRDGLLMVGPTVVIVVAVVVIPVLWNIVLAFQHLSFLEIRDASPFRPFTLDNFREVLGARGFWASLRTTVVYSIGATLGSIALGLVAALALRDSFRGRGLVRAAMLLPYVAPVVAVTFVWQVLLNPQFGIVNAWGQRYLGWDHPQDFLGTEPNALLTVIAFEIWRYFPFAFMFLIARLQAVPGDVIEAAVVDGATPWQRFRYIILPELASVIALLTVLRLIMTFNKFDDVYLLTGGTAGTEVVAVRVFNYLTGRFDAGSAAAQAVVLSLVMAVFLLIYLKWLARTESEES
ncbi:sugar ABC transporter permease [Luteipulveratus sp. YIM 133132]|uniref:Sugar ABC transporter permease n=1 Tax=Luteipulveratus flavus TaxID=3031728 RepID=A0ABT6C6E0_9MICO|nr:MULTISPECIES: sugar ABC transporter permease [unclassified Luteipulveratus]MDE9365221.1 sugar ABC transporter permease [Luteipulveratus sp. YIM 133132]MDF8264442.1 sugar ABC transporter permease [Luteipulveratus sp. YIM 133296]